MVANIPGLWLKRIAVAGLIVASIPLAANAQVGKSSSSDDFSMLPTISDASLAQMHGRGGNIVYSVAGTNNLNATINGSSITAGGNVTNGSVNFSGNAMQNFSGLSNFVANTGNNNNLQAAMVVNVTLQ
ncbi:MAG: hypothetical protein KGO02_16070 [Alphaproteobacteria bacterium]|nr:hypothetical protein [Alphaproteobacteria bacterium]